MMGLNYERRMMAKRNAELTKEVEALRPKVKDLEWRLSLSEAALRAVGEADKKIEARADLAAERERELVRALEWYEIWLKDINRRGKLGETARSTLARDAGAFALRALQPHSREGGEE